MPPLNTKKSSDDPGVTRKDVEFVAKDDDDQVATGIVMVPDKVDLQNDFVREDQIRAFADQFENFEEVGEAGGGVMHAVFPSEHLTLQRNEVLDESEDIGGASAPAGAWIQAWKFEDAQLWELVEDGILDGFSVGIDAVRYNGPYEQDDVDDVEVPGEIDEDELVWQIVDGIMREVSAVDIPAVPDAEILDKSAVEKRLREHLGNRDAFVEEAIQRGHSEADAERLWEYLNDAVDIEGAGEPGKESVARRVGRTVLAALSGNVLTDTESVDTTERTAAAADGDAADTDTSGDAGGGADGDGGAQESKDAPEGDTSDTSEHMSDSDTNDDGEDKSLAEKNSEQISELTETVENLTEAITGPEPETATVELDGETYEVRADAAKAVLGVGEDEEVADAIERLNEKAARVDEVEARLDTLVEQSGHDSDQLRASTSTGEGDGEESSKLDDVSAALS
jgi:hypothetical protein